VAKLQFEDKLRSRAEEFAGSLKRAGIEAAIIVDSFRQYAVKISVYSSGKDSGRAVLYYSPKSESFSLKLNEIKDRSLAPLIAKLWKATPAAEAPDARYEIYVDGSFINGATGYGAVVLKNGKVIDELCGRVDASEVNGTRQVAGELVAVREALTWCRAHSVQEVDIYYDYLGIEKWATRQWKTNQPLTKNYAQFVSSCPIKIHWHKVDSHTGNRWNDRADALAKKGAGPARASAVETDLVSELLEKADRWIEFLMVNGIEAGFDQVYNEQFARMNIIEKDEVVGIFDLYNTRKKRLSPYFHNFRDESLKLRIESLWQEFRSSQG
jgi:ribonuclease HI